MSSLPSPDAGGKFHLAPGLAAAHFRSAKVRPHNSTSQDFLLITRDNFDSIDDTFSAQTTPTNTVNMPGVSVRDVPADKFINAYAAFLKRQGKLPIPG